MRATRNPEMILEKNGSLIGINLGADYCAEHEWGIKGIQRKLGIDTTKLGLDKRVISKTNSDLSWLRNIEFNSNKKPKVFWSGFWMGDFYGKPYFDDGGCGELYAQWDDGGFCALAYPSEKRSQLEKIYEAFAKNDIAIWLGGGGVFENAGLCIAIASALPKDMVDKWLAYDLEALKIKEEFAATGIEDKLKAAHKAYYALSPRRDKDGSLVYWLNPMDQDKNKFGWFKLKDLEAWINNKGPIPKKKK